MGMSLAMPFLLAADHFKSSAALPAGVKAIEAPGLHNLFAVGTNVFSGCSPEGDQAFASLARLGVKTIITVDGAKPDVESARKHGIRYVHLPHGYDGIGADLRLQLAKAGRTLPGPIYVHCHHGKHRGPTAVAVICMANSGWTTDQAESWLVAAGTATNYAGLYNVVQTFSAPTAEAMRGVPDHFPERAVVSGLVDTMVEIDEHWEHLKTLRAAGYQAPKRHPDLKPANEAVILWEHYREAQRLPDSAHHGSNFVTRLQAAEIEVVEAERLLRLFAREAKPDLRVHLDNIFDAMAGTCASCHQAYRDRPGIKAQ